MTYSKNHLFILGKYSMTSTLINRVSHHFSDGIYAREYFLRAGVTVPTHAHLYDHLSILASGNVEVTVDGITSKYSAPAIIEIKKNKKHTVLAYTDTIWICVHATSETDLDAMDSKLIGENNAVL